MKAPPPVETCDNLLSAPFVPLTRFPVSPPPITVVAPYSVLFMKFSNKLALPTLNLSNSKTPTGPFHTRVLDLPITSPERALVRGPASRPYYPSGIPVFISNTFMIQFGSNLSPDTKSAESEV